ncbi:four helix bundle protein [Candidatus Collierbacteria bacterium]|nr:four helix bundle protein [Candidatus Collierbacteria bacterium]
MSKATAIKSFRQLEIWRLSHQLVVTIYKFTKVFPTLEKFSLTNQLLRAVVSIPANIAEGYGRKSNKEFIQFLYISLGSLEEVRYYLILSADLGYISHEQADQTELLLNEIRSKTIAFIRFLEIH